MATILRISLGYVVIAKLLGAGGAYANHYTYTQTPFDSPDGSRLWAKSINDSGQIVGWRNYNGGVAGYLKVGTNYITFDYPGATDTPDTLGCGINNSGQIVRYYDDYYGTTHGFLFSGGVYTSIDYPGATMTYPYGINTSGQIVGQCDIPSSIHYIHSFIATPITSNAASIYQLLLHD